MTTAAARAANPEYPEFPILRRATTEYMEICSEDGRNLCTVCRCSLDPGGRFISVYGVRLCFNCVWCPVCKRVNDETTEPVKVHGVTRHVHEDCIFGVHTLTGFPVETMAVRAIRAKPPKPGFYHRATDADAPRTEFDAPFVYVLPEDMIADALSDRDPDDACGVCHSEWDDEIIAVAGEQLHKGCATCRSCEHPYDKKTSWLETTDSAGSPAGPLFAMCAFCFGLLYTPRPEDAGDADRVDDPQGAFPIA